jgi:hypothetical protein
MMFDHHFAHDQYVLDMRRYEAELERRRVITERLAEQRVPRVRRGLLARWFGSRRMRTMSPPEPRIAPPLPAVR